MNGSPSSSCNPAASASPRRTAMVLCGGQSTRMGQPKAWLPFGPETMLQRIVRVLSDEVEQLVVVAAQQQQLPELPDAVLVVRDQRPTRGPLEGIAAGLEASPADAAVYVTSCDVPRLRQAFVRYLFQQLQHDDVVVPQDDGFRHPLAAVYRQGVLPTVRQLLAQDQLRPMFLFSQVRTRFLPVDELRGVDQDLASLDNVNCPEDYQRALRAAGFAP